MSVKNRLKLYLKHQNLTVKEFEKSINVSNGYVNSISKSIGIEKLEDISQKYSDLNLNWLLVNDGDMLKKGHNISKTYQSNKLPYEKVFEFLKILFTQEDELLKYEKYATWKKLVEINALNVYKLNKYQELIKNKEKIVNL